MGPRFQGYSRMAPWPGGATGRPLRVDSSEHLEEELVGRLWGRRPPPVCPPVSRTEAVAQRPLSAEAVRPPRPRRLSCEAPRVRVAHCRAFVLM